MAALRIGPEAVQDGTTAAVAVPFYGLETIAGVTLSPFERRADMRPHLLIAALAGLSIAAAAAAEPAKAPVRKAEQPAERAAPVVVASVNEQRAAEAAAEPQAEPPVKQRRGRVTSCRCGDQNPSD